MVRIVLKREIDRCISCGTAVDNLCKHRFQPWTIAQIRVQANESMSVFKLTVLNIRSAAYRAAVISTTSALMSVWTLFLWLKYWFWEPDVPNFIKQGWHPKASPFCMLTCGLQMAVLAEVVVLQSFTVFFSVASLIIRSVMEIVLTAPWTIFWHHAMSNLYSNSPIYRISCDQFVQQTYWSLIILCQLEIFGAVMLVLSPTIVPP